MASSLCPSMGCVNAPCHLLLCCQSPQKSTSGMVDKTAVLQEHCSQVGLRQRLL